MRHCQTTAACPAGAVWCLVCPCACHGCLQPPWTRLETPSEGPQQPEDLLWHQEGIFAADLSGTVHRLTVADCSKPEQHVLLARGLVLGQRCLSKKVESHGRMCPLYIFATENILSLRICLSQDSILLQPLLRAPKD